MALSMLLFASAAQAVGVVRFDGTGSGPDPGISEATAFGAGVPIFRAQDDALLEVVDDIDPANSSLLFEERISGFSVSDRSSPASATQPWQLSNNTGRDLGANLALVFLRPLPNEVIVDGVGQSVDYSPFDVALNLANGFDWALLQLRSLPGAGTDEIWYYPAIVIGPLAAGASLAQPFDMDMILRTPQIFERTNSELVLGLPDWKVRGAWLVPIPEPSTALLVGLGCAALALRPSRRS